MGCGCGGGTGEDGKGIGFGGGTGEGGKGCGVGLGTGGGGMGCGGKGSTFDIVTVSGEPDRAGVHSMTAELAKAKKAKDAMCLENRSFIEIFQYDDISVAGVWHRGRLQGSAADDFE